jgi:hypothetical protein
VIPVYCGTIALPERAAIKKQRSQKLSGTPGTTVGTLCGPIVS